MKRVKIGPIPKEYYSFFFMLPVCVVLTVVTCLKPESLFIIVVAGTSFLLGCLYHVSEVLHLLNDLETKSKEGEKK